MDAKGMKVLVVGSGAREHAIIWKLSQSPKVEKIYSAPGNPGIAEFATVVDIAVDDINGLLQYAIKEGCDLTVVGPEVPLDMGIVDAFKAAGLKIFGPTKNAARIESSKDFAKELMKRKGIPTANYVIFTSKDDALSYLENHQGPIVVKLDGLAAGKGVIVANNREEAILAVCELFEINKTGPVLLEEFLTGRECSILAVSDGVNIVTLTPAQDHKRAYDGNKGPNTGGMGTVAPSTAISKGQLDEVTKNILIPAIEGMREMGCPFVGVLFAGLMMTKDGPKVLEFNSRFGDPETEVVLPLLKSDLLDLFTDAIEGKLDEHKAEFYDDACVCVIMAASGYPGSYRKGDVIELPKLSNDTYIFQAGCKMNGDDLVTSGGRVLAVVARGNDIKNAKERAYELVSKVHFDEAHYRRDIGDY